MDVADIVIALAAAMLLGVGFVLQQHAAEQAPKAYFLRLRLITDLLHRPRWLVGLAVMIAGQLCSAWAVGHLDLSLAEPLLATNLIFALALAVPLSRQQLRATEIIGAVLLSGGVAALSLARSPERPTYRSAPPLTGRSPPGSRPSLTASCTRAGGVPAGNERSSRGSRPAWSSASRTR